MHTAMHELSFISLSVKLHEWDEYLKFSMSNLSLFSSGEVTNILLYFTQQNVTHRPLKIARAPIG